MKKFLAAVILSVIAGCNPGNSQYSRGDMWFHSANPVAEDKVDVFYIASVNFLESRDAEGNSLPCITLDGSQRKVLDTEISYAQGMFGDSLNFFSPYFHQLTFETATGGGDVLGSAFADNARETGEAFRYYIDHLNGGRPFILAGFSLGAMMAVEILKNMDESVYSRLVAAYIMGYRLSPGDLGHKYVRAATDRYSRGKAISFNSVSTPEGIFHLTTDSAAAIINPVSWSTDTAPASFTYNGQHLTVAIDSTLNILIVKGFEAEDTPWSKLFPEGNLHHWDLLFYRDAIHRNALDRAYGKARKGFTESKN